MIPDWYNIVFNPDKEKYSFKEYMAPYFSKSHAFAVFSWRDIRPFIKQLHKVMLFILRKLKKSKPLKV